MCVAAQTSFGEWDRVYPQRTIDEENGRAAAALTGVRRARAKAERWRNIVLGGGEEVEGEERAEGEAWEASLILDAASGRGPIRRLRFPILVIC